MKKNTLVILFLGICCFFTSCLINSGSGPCDSQWDPRLKLMNNSDSNIYIVHSALYPDTSFKNTMNDYNHSLARVGYASKRTKSGLGEYCWDDYFNGIKSDTLMIFIVLDEAQGRENLKDYHTVLKRYDLTFQDLERMSWTIIYP